MMGVAEISIMYQGGRMIIVIGTEIVSVIEIEIVTEIEIAIGIENIMIKTTIETMTGIGIKNIHLRLGNIPGE